MAERPEGLSLAAIQRIRERPSMRAELGECVQWVPLSVGERDALCAMAEAHHAPTPTCATCRFARHGNTSATVTDEKGTRRYMGAWCDHPIASVSRSLLVGFGCTLHEPKPSEVTP